MKELMSSVGGSGSNKKRRAADPLVEDIRARIESGALAAGQYLLPERRLATEYGLSMRAVRDGLAQLAAEGLIRREQGRGTIVEARASAAAPKQKTVAVIFQGRVRDASTAEEFDALQQSFQSEGYGIALYVTDGSMEKEAELVTRLAAERVPGLVLFSAHPMTSDAHLRAAQAAGMKIVAFDHDFPDANCSFVGINDRQAARDATEHLIRLNCRELVLINSQRNWTSHTLREQGFEDACAGLGAGIPRHVIRLADRPSRAALAADLRSQLMSLLGEARGVTRPLGVVVWWDEMALHAMDCLREAGLQIPSDAKVVGFANEEIGELADVPLTTIEIPRHDIAKLVSTVLVGQMHDPSRPSMTIRLKARLVIRESCGTYGKRSRNVGHAVGHQR
ncbi:MAG: GntR family transcriptional regulator [Tepidisphaeraceae bacterium]